MIARVLAGGAVLAAMAFLCWIAARAGPELIGAAGAYHAADTPLTGTEGAPVRLAQGPRLVVFGYVGCADRCPLTLRTLSGIGFSHRAGRSVRVTFVDIDPWRDTRARVDRYVAHFGDVQGAVGELAALEANEAALGVHPVTRLDDVAAHDTRIFVLDRDGVLVGALSADMARDDIRAIVRRRLGRDSDLVTPVPR
jgi:cytochrome oxidase Cu insertion factor (SCO1/SenC/PrrC family)